MSERLRAEGLRLAYDQCVAVHDLSLSIPPVASP